MKAQTIYFDEDMLERYKPYMKEGEKLSPFINRMLLENLERREHLPKTPEHAFIVLCNSLAKLREHYKKGNITFNNTVE